MPDSWATYFYLGKAELQLNHTSAAIPLLQQAAAMNPDDSSPFYLLAKAFKSEGHPEDATAAMQRVVALHSTALAAERRALKERHIVSEQ